ncbi:hypothetical protein AGLY_005672, partial [Aphis glycines]
IDTVNLRLKKEQQILSDHIVLKSKVTRIKYQQTIRTMVLTVDTVRRYKEKNIYNMVENIVTKISKNVELYSSHYNTIMNTYKKIGQISGNKESIKTKINIGTAMLQCYTGCLDVFMIRMELYIERLPCQNISPLLIIQLITHKLRVYDYKTIQLSQCRLTFTDAKKQDSLLLLNTPPLFSWNNRINIVSFIVWSFNRFRFSLTSSSNVETCVMEFKYLNNFCRVITKAVLNNIHNYY